MAATPNANGKRPIQDGHQPASKKVKSTYDTIITVTVGETEEKASFLVHQDLICDRSQFFKAACSTRWLGGQSRVVELPQHLPRTFKAYLQWAYSSTSDLAGIVDELCNDDGTEYADRNITVKRRRRSRYLAELWVLADYLVDPGCKNEVINNLMHELAADHKFPNISACLLKYIYEKTAPQSGLRKWLVDAMLPFMSSAYLQRWLSRFPTDMVTDMFKAFMDRKGYVRRADMPTEKEASKYYE